ncbi:hypothetical protein BJ508DRAFT_319373 [Ascobolus immersus RN42]|uniref:Phosphosulfolactate synthase n=1 Tax=Ascobolus immersus RN42 TaxID=1160509 RepID=A0A3N4I1R1_ASCIM|nr:hypothetical protein BJ508DRAFT_319373 [Ascobolus immersus RN42]
MFSTISLLLTIKPPTVASTIRSLSTTPPRPTSKVIPLLDDPSGLPFPSNPLPPKPRKTAVTEIRGPYYSSYGPSHLRDILECYSPYIDGLKFAGGSFALLPRHKLEEMIQLARGHGVYTSTGGWIEHLLANCRGGVAFGGKDGGVVKAVDTYLSKCKELGFDVVELSAGFLSLPGSDWCRLAERVQKAGLTPKPELGILFGAGGDTPEISGEGGSSKGLIKMGKRFLDMGVERLMIESEGITENVAERMWREDVVEEVWDELKDVWIWVNVFIDHSQVVQLAGLRKGVWGTNDLWGRVVGFRPDLEGKEK